MNPRAFRHAELIYRPILPPMSEILLISWYYYPASAVGARRVFNLKKYLEECGHRVTVLAAHPRQYDHVDPRLADLTKATRNIARATARFHIRVPPRRQHEGSLEGFFRRCMFLLSKPVAWMRFPDPYSGWIAPALRRAEKLHRHAPFDVVLSSGSPWSAFVAGDKFSARHALPHVMDYRDPWTASERELNRAENLSERSEILEQDLIRRARLIVVNTATTARLFESAFGGDVIPKLLLVRNGFDPEIYERIRGSRSTRALQPETKFRLVHTGLYYASRRLRSMIEAVGQLVATGEVTETNFEVLSYGSLHSEDRRLVQSLKLDALFPEHDFVPYEESLQALTRSSMNLLVIGPGHAAMIPAKLYDYMMVEKPIFAVGPAHSEVREILTKHGYGVYADVASIPDIVEKLRHVMAHRHEYQAAPLQAPDEFNIRNQVQRLAEVVSRL